MLRTTHESSVTEDQIDHLGHMNVRFYGVNAHAGLGRLLSELPGWADRAFEVHDTYTRHHREQMVGNALVVRSAIIDASPDGLRVHHELANAANGELAATFVHGVRAVAPDARPALLPPDVVAAAQVGAIEIPDYAASRTVSLASNLIGSCPSLAEATHRGLAMRLERSVPDEECTEDGSYRVDLAPMLTWGGEPTNEELGIPLHRTPDGRTMGWAILEPRVQINRLPRVGDRVQAFGAAVAVHDKIVHRLHWTYDVTTGEPLTAFEVVNLAFDPDARRAMSIPENLRDAELARLQPDLAPVG